MKDFTGTLPELGENPTLESMIDAASGFFRIIGREPMCMLEFEAEYAGEMNNRIAAWVWTYNEIWSQL